MDAAQRYQEEHRMENRYLNETLTKRFVSYLYEAERRKGTIEKYRRDLRALTTWLGGNAVTKEQVVSWKEHLIADGYAPTTINSMLAAVNSFFHFVGWEDCRIHHLRLQRKLFRDSEKELTRAEYKRLLAAAQTDSRWRLELLMETICATGIRVSELKYITVEAAAKGRAEISMKGKIRCILMSSKLSRKLLKYAKKQGISSGSIFVTRNGNPMSRRQIWAEMKSLCEAAGVAPSKVFPHNLRHLFARVFYESCHDITKVADMLGHSSIDTTRLYLRTTTKEQRKQLERMNLVS